MVDMLDTENKIAEMRLKTEIKERNVRNKKKVRKLENMVGKKKTMLEDVIADRDDLLQKVQLLERKVDELLDERDSYIKELKNTNAKLKDAELESTLNKGGVSFSQDAFLQAKDDEIRSIKEEMI